MYLKIAEHPKVRLSKFSKPGKPLLRHAANKVISTSCGNSRYTGLETSQKEVASKKQQRCPSETLGTLGTPGTGEIRTC